MRLILTLLTILFAWDTHAQMTLRNGALRNYVGTSWDKNLVNGLVSYWKLDETSGARYDAYSTNHLTAVNSPSYTTGKVGNAATFVNTSSQRLETSSSSAIQFNSQPFTVTAWIYSSAFAANSGICGNWDGSKGFALDFFNNKLEFGASTSAVANSFGVPPTNTWIFVAGWYNGATTISIQVNNGSANTVSSSISTSTANFKIGAYTAGGTYWNGYIDEVGIWNRVLTAAEITQLYKSGTGTTFPTFAHHSRRIPESLYDTPANPLLAALYRKPEPISLDIP